MKPQYLDPTKVCKHQKCNFSQNQGPWFSYAVLKISSSHWVCNLLPLPYLQLLKNAVRVQQSSENLFVGLGGCCYENNFFLIFRRRRKRRRQFPEKMFNWLLLSLHSSYKVMINTLALESNYSSMTTICIQCMLVGRWHLPR